MGCGVENRNSRMNCCPFEKVDESKIGELKGVVDEKTESIEVMLPEERRTTMIRSSCHHSLQVCQNPKRLQPHQVRLYH